jgi:TPR repeat protein
LAANQEATMTRGFRAVQWSAVLVVFACAKPLGEPARGQVPPPCAPEECERACQDRGDAGACTRAAELAWEGKTGQFDAAQALRPASRGCDGGDQLACTLLGQHHERGIGTEWDPARAVALYEKACTAGIGLGCFRLGGMYGRGHGVDVDPWKERAYVGRAVAIWLPQCRGAQPQWCMHAASVVQRSDPDGAYELYKDACGGGIKSGCVKIAARSTGSVHLHVAKLRQLEAQCEDGEASACEEMASRATSTRFAELEQRACELGAPQACTTIGVLYDVGEGVAKDDELKLRYLSRACNRGMSEACVYLAEDADESAGREREVEGFLLRACQMGNREACDNLSEARAVAGDDAAAVRWATEACRMGSVRSCERLIERDRELPGVMMDAKRALYRAACDDGKQPACARLDKLDKDDDAIVRAVRDAIASQDAAAFGTLAPGEVVVRGLWFDSEDCAKQFSATQRVTAALYPALLRCLATLGLKPEMASAHRRAQLVYEPGVAVALDVYGGAIRRILGPSSSSKSARAPVVTPEALHAHDAGARAVEPGEAVRDLLGGSSAAFSAQLFLCVDTAGKVSRAEITRGSGLDDYDRAVESAAAAWTFTPFVVRGRPVVVCASDLITYPPDRTRRSLPPLLPAIDDLVNPGIGAGHAPPNVAPTTLEAYRIAGERNIVPDDATKTEISRARKTRLIGSYKLCLTSSGRIRTVTRLKSTGFAEYDQRLMQKIRDWRYRPFMLNGAPTPVCTAVTFIYSQR